MQCITLHLPVFSIRAPRLLDPESLIISEYLILVTLHRIILRTAYLFTHSRPHKYRNALLPLYKYIRLPACQQASLLQGPCSHTLLSSAIPMGFDDPCLVVVVPPLLAAAHSTCCMYSIHTFPSFGVPLAYFWPASGLFSLGRYFHFLPTTYTVHPPTSYISPCPPSAIPFSPLSLSRWPYHGSCSYIFNCSCLFFDL